MDTQVKTPGVKKTDEMNWIRTTEEGPWLVVNPEGVVMTKGFRTQEEAMEWRDTAFFGYYSHCDIIQRTQSKYEVALLKQEKIMSFVEAFQGSTGISWETLTTSTRVREMSDLRHICAFLMMRVHPVMTPSEVMPVVGRDRTNFYHMDTKVRTLVGRDPLFTERFKRVRLGVLHLLEWGRMDLMDQIKEEGQS